MEYSGIEHPIAISDIANAQNKGNNLLAILQPCIKCITHDHLYRLFLELNSSYIRAHHMQGRFAS